MREGVSGNEFAKSAELLRLFGSLTRRRNEPTKLVFTPYVPGYGFLADRQVELEAEFVDLVRRVPRHFRTRSPLYLVTFSDRMEGTAKENLSLLRSIYTAREELRPRFEVSDECTECYCNCGSDDCAHDCGGSDCACDDCDCGWCVASRPGPWRHRADRTRS